MYEIIKIIDARGMIRYEGIVYRIPLREASILEQGKAIYNSTELCNLRREIVKKRMYFQIEEFVMSRLNPDGQVKLDELPDSTANMLDL